MPSKVILVRGRGARPEPGSTDARTVSRMLERGFILLAGRTNPAEAVRSMFSPNDRVGLKINAIAGRALTTPPEVAFPLGRLLVGGGLAARRITIWDRTNREIREAGYKLNLDGNEFRVFGTDTDGVGYGVEPLVHRDIGSLYSKIQTGLVTASISLAVLKDHGLAGVTAGMKNYFGAVHNPNKYHDTNCDPYVAQLFESSPIRDRHRLTILDALTVQFHRGPSHHARWAERAETLIFSLDPVAADAVGWRVIESLRKAKGLPSLAEEKRAPAYIATAERLGLGKAGTANIQIVEDEV
ncbi:MAG: DUF362 domain-containing protein [Candidatus Aminicenantes bacterium]|nr:DUF362 domain-containing protein [Candidatus Aminicenantes bacterium]